MIKVRTSNFLLVLVLASACAAKSAPPLPPTLAYPDFVYPTATPAAQGQAVGVDRGWRYLQNNDLTQAEREFAAAVKRVPGLFPARTGQGYVALAQQDYRRALEDFDDALRTAPAYAPALVGKGQALLSLMRDSEALAAFQAALKADGSLPNLSQRIDVLRFRSLQNMVAVARLEVAAGRLDEGRAAYQRALEAAPDSAVLYRELGALERQRKNAAAALADFTRAFELDPSDVVSLSQIAELLGERQDFSGEEAAYRRAASLEPGAGFEAKADAAAGRARDGRLPAEFRAIPSAAQITRGDLAALIGVRLEDTLKTAPRSQIVTTDTQGHWAAAWIAEVAATDIMPPFDNHTFQPRAPVRRVELAEALNAALRLIARGQPALTARLAGRPAVADVRPTHLSYPAVAAAVSSGVLPLLDGGRFDLARPVSGPEAVAAVDRLRAFDQPR